MVPNPLSTRLSHLRGRQNSAKGPVSRDTSSRHRKLQNICKMCRENWCQINPNYLLHMESQNRDMHEIHIALGSLLISFTSLKYSPKIIPHLSRLKACTFIHPCRAPGSPGRSSEVPAQRPWSLVASCLSPGQRGQEMPKIWKHLVHMTCIHVLYATSLLFLTNMTCISQSGMAGPTLERIWYVILRYVIMICMLIQIYIYMWYIHIYIYTYTM